MGIVSNREFRVERDVRFIVRSYREDTFLAKPVLFIVEIMPSVMLRAGAWFATPVEDWLRPTFS